MRVWKPSSKAICETIAPRHLFATSWRALRGKGPLSPHTPLSPQTPLSLVRPGRAQAPSHARLDQDLCTAVLELHGTSIRARRAKSKRCTEEQSQSLLQPGFGLAGQARPNRSLRSQNSASPSLALARQGRPVPNLALRSQNSATLRLVASTLPWRITSMMLQFRHHHGRDDIHKQLH